MSCRDSQEGQTLLTKCTAPGDREEESSSLSALDHLAFCLPRNLGDRWVDPTGLTLQAQTLSGLFPDSSLVVS